MDWQLRSNNCMCREHCVWHSTSNSTDRYSVPVLALLFTGQGWNALCDIFGQPLCVADRHMLATHCMLVARACSVKLLMATTWLMHGTCLCNAVAA
jgi:hypothetical protein